MAKRRAVEIVFRVEEDPVDGGYVARALGHGITTQAESIAELKKMIRDAVCCHFDKPRGRLRCRLDSRFRGNDVGRPETTLTVRREPAPRGG